MVQLSPKDIYKIAEIIDDQIFVIFPSLNKIYNYFTDIAKIMSRLKLPIV